MPLPKSFVLPDFDTPDISEVPAELSDLLHLLDTNWTVELYQKQWTFGRLGEWETRDVMQRSNNLDLMTKSYIQRVETLVRGIVKIHDIKNNTDYECMFPEQKILLRNILLGLDSMIVSDLFDAYKIGSQQLEEQFRRKHPEISEKLKENFFGKLEQEFSGNLASETPMTGDSGKS